MNSHSRPRHESSMTGVLVWIRVPLSTLGMGGCAVTLRSKLSPHQPRWRAFQSPSTRYDESSRENGRLASRRPMSVLFEAIARQMGYIQRRADDLTFEWSPELIKAIQDRVLAGDHRRDAGLYGVGRWVVDSAPMT